MNTNAQAKYRPCLTAEMIDYIVEVCRESRCDKAISVLGVLAPMQAKIHNRGIAPSYVVSAKIKSNDIDSICNDAAAQMLSPEEKRAAAYAKYQISKESCTIDELDLAETYMWENELMDAATKEIYEQRIFNI